MTGRSMMRGASRPFIAALAAALFNAVAVGAGAPEISKFSSASGSAAPAPWRALSIAGSKIPATPIDLTEIDALRVARIAADRSYGNWAHAVKDWTPTAASTLSWRWRLDHALQGADLKTKAGDDAALKVCVSFELPLSALDFGERTLLSLARARTGEALPAATLCYIWEPNLPAGTLLPNAYTARVRYLVLDGQGAPLGQWRAHDRKLQADFLRAFGHESTTVPPISAVLIGGDADNTGSRSLGYVGDLSLKP